MIITYFGHDEFLMQSAAGVKIITDPYKPQMLGVKEQKIEADIATISHSHEDHNYKQKLLGDVKFLETEGDFEYKNLHISSIKSFHDDKHGALRGENLIFLYEIDGLRLAHLGDLGHTLNKEQTAFLSGLDILFLPVGGKYTIDAKTAKQVADTLKPKVIIPMHYRMKNAGLKDIDSLDAFLDEVKPAKASYVNILRITKEDISELKPVTVMEPHIEAI